MYEVNLWDSTFEHLRTKSGNFSMIKDKSNNHFRYLYRKTNFDGVTIFTDNFLNPVYIKSVKSNIKIGWMIERREVHQHAYVLVDKYIDLLDVLLTNDTSLLQKYPEKCKFVPFGGTWVEESNYKIFDKTKGISMVYSNKIGGLQGWNLRHQVASVLKGKVDLFGTGADKFIEKKEEALTDYKYSIVIENVRKDNYFTEKLLDCFAVGTIPIYWGCPNIEEFFDPRGIITFETADELYNIINGIEDTRLEQEAILHNLEECKKYDVVENWMYENILKEVLDG